MKKILLAAILLFNHFVFAQTVDLGFGNFPGYTIAEQDYGYSDILVLDQNIYALSASASENLNVSKYNLNGIIDTTFGEDGFKNISGAYNAFSTMFNYAQFLHISADNRLLITTGHDFNTVNKVLATKLNSDGTLDTSYGVSGQVLSTLPGKFTVNAVRKSTDDEFWIFGNNSIEENDFQGSQIIIKIDSQGNYDTSFGTNGIFYLPFNESIDAAYFSGESIYFFNRGDSEYLTKFDLNTLSYDLQFAGDGQLQIDNFFPFQEIRSFAIDGNDIYVLCDFTSENQSSETFVVKYSNEVVDSTFGINGIGRFPFLNTDILYIASFSIKKHSETLFIFGEIATTQNVSTSSSFFAKLNLDGSVNENFGNGGVYIDTLFEVSTLPTSYVYQENSIIIAGMTLLPEILGQPFMAKYRVQNNLATVQNNVPNFSFYPNPVQDFLHFQNAEEISSIAIYDVVGRLIKSTLISEDRIDLSFLQTGNYIVKATTPSKVLTFKILKI